MKSRKNSSSKEKKQKNNSNSSTLQNKSTDKNLSREEQYEYSRSSSKGSKKNSKSTSKKNKQKQQMKAEFLPGQRYQTPEQDDGAYAFYKSLYESNPSSQIARKYCLQHGVLQPDEANMLLKQMSKLPSKKK